MAPLSSLTKTKQKQIMKWNKKLSKMEGGGWREWLVFKLSPTPWLPADVKGH